MTNPVILRCPDGHLRRVIYDLAAYIADYPEQVYLAGVVQGWCPRYVSLIKRLLDGLTGCHNRCTSLPDDLDKISGPRSHVHSCQLAEIIDSKSLWDEYGIDDDITVRRVLVTGVTGSNFYVHGQPFTVHFARADIHEMLTPDLLHQLIKGTFKDHLVQWVGDYLALEHGEARANEILDDIDSRCVSSFVSPSHWILNTIVSIAAMPLYPEIRRFPQGRRFKQWTGDDSKALMKVSCLCADD